MKLILSSILIIALVALSMHFMLEVMSWEAAMRRVGFTITVVGFLSAFFLPRVPS